MILLNDVGGIYSFSLQNIHLKDSFIQVFRGLSQIGAILHSSSDVLLIIR